MLKIYSVLSGKEEGGNYYFLFLNIMFTSRFYMNSWQTACRKYAENSVENMDFLGNSADRKKAVFLSLLSFPLLSCRGSVVNGSLNDVKPRKTGDILELKFNSIMLLASSSANMNHCCLTGLAISTLCIYFSFFTLVNRIDQLIQLQFIFFKLINWASFF